MHVDDGVGQEVVSGHPERRGLSVTQRPERQQQHGQTHALEYGLELAGPCGGDDFAARTLHDEETHNGDTNFANQEQDGYPPASSPNAEHTIIAPQVSSLSAIGSMSLPISVT